MRICSCSSQEATRPSKCRPCSSHNSQGPSQGHTLPRPHPPERTLAPTLPAHTWWAHSLVTDLAGTLIVTRQARALAGADAATTQPGDDGP